jgi:hypothetical protein
MTQPVEGGFFKGGFGEARLYFSPSRQQWANFYFVRQPFNIGMSACWAYHLGWAKKKSGKKFNQTHFVCGFAIPAICSAGCNHLDHGKYKAKNPGQTHGYAA